MRDVLITGGSDGMGRATALRLAAPGRQIIVVGRNKQRGDAVARALGDAGATGLFVPADLSTVDGMCQAADEVRNITQRLDIIVHAAGGVFDSRRTLTEEGLERSFAIQVLARYGVTMLLMDLLRAGQDQRVVAIAGGGSTRGGLDLADLQGEKTHSLFGSIRKTALANDLLTLALAARYEGIGFYNYGPGLVRTKVSMPNLLSRVVMKSIGRLFSRSPEEAAEDIVALVSGSFPAGFYGPRLKRNELCEEASPSRADDLWTYCERRFAAHRVRRRGVRRREASPRVSSPRGEGRVQGGSGISPGP